MNLPNEKLKIEITPSEAGKKAVLRGVIDEDSNLTELLQNTNSLIVNFKEITAINSCGIRSWVNLLKELKEVKVIYEECPPLIVRQMNMVPSFMGHAQAISVYTPYVCSECEAEKLVITPDSLFSQGKITVPESMPCEKCQKGVMEIDGQTKQYFAFSK